MDDESNLSVKERIAQLKLNQVGRPSGQATPNGTHTSIVLPKRSGPVSQPIIPARPNVQPRAASTNIPPSPYHAPVYTNGTSKLPPIPPSFVNGNASDQHDGTCPPLSSRSSTPSARLPTLPPRKPSAPSPALPPRRPSATSSLQPDYSLSRRDSNSSMSSIATGHSSLSGISTYSDRSLAPAFDPANLPPLPPKQTAQEKARYFESASASKERRRPSATSRKSEPRVATRQEGTTAPPMPPPAIRRADTQPPGIALQELRDEPADARPEPAPRPISMARAPLPLPVPAAQPQPAKRIPPAEPPRPRRSALEMGLEQPSGARPGVSPRTTATANTSNGPPPPVPISSRPDLCALQASKPKPSAPGSSPATISAPASSPSCLHCRDFSGPDNHAARYPRQNLPPNADVGWLAMQLTGPFGSHTDKARAIFTWLHHNIAYDAVAFFTDNVKSSSPAGTMTSGLAVCEGYAGLFAALAVKAGLESTVIGGGCKGFGHTPLKPGDPIPAFKSVHAWNVVKIDGGHWKLIDACWGAGHLDGNTRQYVKSFSPQRFTQSNEIFGLDHFPIEMHQQYRADGRVVSWEQFVVGPAEGTGPEVFAGYVQEEGISAASFRPRSSPLALDSQAPSTRFSFQKICPHWDPLRNGKGAYFLYLLDIEGTKERRVFRTNGEVWWCDVPTRDLGSTGRRIAIMVVTDFEGKSGRGLTAEQWENPTIGGGSFGGVCHWLVQ